MTSKRIIFTLLYDQGFFCVSRNFRLQRIGDLDWLLNNYDLSNVGQFVDEIHVMNVSRERQTDWKNFQSTVKALSHSCFVPVAVGGFRGDIALAAKLIHGGADKLVLNSLLVSGPGRLQEFVDEFGRQCLVGSLDIVDFEGEGLVRDSQDPGRRLHLQDVLSEQVVSQIGELLLRSVSRDGTGFGPNLDLLNHLTPRCEQLGVILAGGFGKGEHMMSALRLPQVSAIATGNLLNFVGRGFREARNFCLESGADLFDWETQFKALRQVL